ncbi:Conserved_hypothetical protein [Hexamita inflata]|uniref:Uncharacterized protein n=1 Tax=Hexamita inflata TaxID=28002 RepID=A0AA86R9L2_9EUKA|nr:Conserved hypothetical protein [Hexamita inflata]
MVEVVFENFVNYLRSGNTDKLNIISFQQNQQHKINLSTQLIFYRILTKTVVQLRNITFFKGFINLKQLDLSDNDNVDIIPLQYLVNLTSLNISKSDISDISSLITLVNLEVLDMSHNIIQNITSLQNFVLLIDLDISYNCIKDISILKQTKCLKQLRLSNNEGVDIISLQYLTQITYLALNGCGLYEISVLQSLVNLEYLDISWNQIIFFYPIKDLDAKLNAKQNLMVDSSDFFTFFNVNNKLEYLNDQPNEQQILLAWKMKVVDTTTSCIRDINTKRRHQISRKQITIDTLVSLQQREQEIILSLADKVVQMFQQLNSSEQYQ